MFDDGIIQNYCWYDNEKVSIYCKIGTLGFLNNIAAACLIKKSSGHANLYRAGRNWMEDKVNHPSHYETNGIECFDAMTASQGVEAVKNFCACNAFKYIWRYSHKNGIEDLKKANWYINKRIELDGKEEKRYTWNDTLEPDVFMCSQCGASLKINSFIEDDDFKYVPKYCPECGLKVSQSSWR